MKNRRTTKVVRRATRLRQTRDRAPSTARRPGSSARPGVGSASAGPPTSPQRMTKLTRLTSSKVPSGGAGASLARRRRPTVSELPFNFPLSCLYKQHQSSVSLSTE
eukprot:scaffold70678_cov29-Prasinocladus_malaysianus.AAC.1